MSHVSLQSQFINQTGSHLQQSLNLMYQYCTLFIINLISDRLILDMRCSYRNLGLFYSLLLILIASASCSFNLTFQQFLQSTPQTFGIMTVTHARNGIYTYFRRHLDNYATMDCPEMSQISIVWNNDVTPQSVGFVQQQSWKRPVYFVKTPQNSMDNRYMLSDKSKAKVFFQIDDDVLITCAQLRRSFAIWRQSAIGDIGPIMSYAPRGFDFNLKSSQSFTYKDPLKAKFYTINLVGVGWISRFYFQIYNSNKFWEILQMRRIVKQKNNCDDIALNYIISYFFPQLIPQAIKGQFHFQTHPASQFYTPNHQRYRSQCVEQFTQILGYNSLRYLNKEDTHFDKRVVSQSKKYGIYLKRKQLVERFLEQQIPTKQIRLPANLMDLWSKRLKQQIDKPQKRTQFSSEIPILNQQNEGERLQKQIQMIKQRSNKNSQQIKQLSDQLGQFQNSNGKTQKNTPKQQKAKQNIRNGPNLKQSLYYIKMVSIFLCVFVLFMFIYLISDCRQLCKENQQTNTNENYKTQGNIPQQSDSQQENNSGLTTNSK